MRLFIVALLVVGTAAASPRARRHSAQQFSAANINEYVDQILPNIAELLRNKGLDPVALPDDEQTFSEEGPLGITWHGEVGLFDGSLAGLSQVVRAGDAFLDYQDLNFKVNMTLGFSTVELFYGFTCQLMNIGPKGTVDGTVEDLAVFAELGLDLGNMTSPKISLQQLYFSNAGKLKLHIEGIGLDLLDNLIADIVTSLFHDTIIGAIEDKARDIIQDALDSISMKTMVRYISSLLMKQRVL